MKVGKLDSVLPWIEINDWDHSKFTHQTSVPLSFCFLIQGEHKGCGYHDDHGHHHGHEHGHHHGHGHGASKVVALGCVTFTSSGLVYAVDREGDVLSGEVCTFGVEFVKPELAGPCSAVFPDFCWVTNSSGDTLCAPTKGEGHGQHYHFSVKIDKGEASHFVLQCGEEKQSIFLCAGVAPRESGIITPLWKAGAGGKEVVGFLELTQHDDLGDLELWTTDMGDPLDFPAPTAITISFPDHGGKTVQLKARNLEQNEDEDGRANMRGGMTNYFIFSWRPWG
jgi:hypothetical protein